MQIEWLREAAGRVDRTPGRALTTTLPAGGGTRQAERHAHDVDPHSRRGGYSQQRPCIARGVLRIDPTRRLVRAGSTPALAAHEGWRDRCWVARHEAGPVGSVPPPADCCPMGRFIDKRCDIEGRKR